MAIPERFKDRAHAGKLLAQRLAAYAHKRKSVV